MLPSSLLRDLGPHVKSVGMPREGLQFAQNNLEITALQPLCAFLEVTLEFGRVVRKHDIARLLPPHDDVVAADLLDDLVQVGPGAAHEDA